MFTFLKGSIQILVVHIVSRTRTPKKYMWHLFLTSEISSQNMHRHYTKQLWPTNLDFNLFANNVKKCMFFGPPSPSFFDFINIKKNWNSNLEHFQQLLFPPSDEYICFGLYLMPRIFKVENKFHIYFSGVLFLFFMYEYSQNLH